MKEAIEIIDYEAKLNHFKQDIKLAMLTRREKHSSEMDTALKQVGKATLEDGEIKPYSQAYYEAKGKVSIIDELLEKMAKEDV